MLKRSENAVSDIVGEMMILLITVLIFALLVMAVNSIMARDSNPIIKTIVEVTGPDSISIQHSGGDHVSKKGIIVIVNTTAYYVPDNSTVWHVGEKINLTVSGTEQPLTVMVYDYISGTMISNSIIG